MPRNLSIEDQAYNACIDALNDAEARLVDAADERNRAWEAADALHHTGEHGKGALSKKKLVIVPAGR